MRTKNQQTKSLFDILDLAQNEVLTRLAERVMSESNEGPGSTLDKANSVTNEFADELTAWAKRKDDRKRNKDTEAREENRHV